MALTAERPAELTRVSLPGGTWLGDRNTLPRREVMMRAVSAIEEIALLDVVSLPPAERAIGLLTRCLADGDQIAPALSIGDREAVLLHLRRLTIGDTIDAVLTCPSASCASSLEMQVGTKDLLLEPYSDVQRVYEIEVPASNVAYWVRFRLPTSADLASAAGTAREDAELAAAAIFRRCVLDAKKDGVATAVETLPAAVRTTIGDAMASRDPQAEIELQLRCPVCELEFGVVFDVASFFLRELEHRGSRLLAEVHALASHYHWSERDILQMPPSRRERYLQLLAARGGQPT